MTNLNEFSSLNQSETVEQFLSNENRDALSLNKLFAFLRTWNKSIHRNFARLVYSALENSIDVNERDLVSGMNLLHFTCKFGAKKLAQENEALELVDVLIKKGIDLTATCLWVQMNCLHYCAFFDSPLVCEFLLKQEKLFGLLDQRCPSSLNQTALHIACSGLSDSTIRVLVQFGANKFLVDDQNRTAEDCLPKIATDDRRKLKIDSLKVFLHEQHPMSVSSIEQSFKLSERVRLSNNKLGTVRYHGSVPFGVNLWYGIELDEPTGKHDGCVGGVRYFSCPPNRGIFVQGSSLRKLTPIVSQSPERERRFRPINYPIVDTSSVASRVDSGLKRDSSADDQSNERFHVADRVSLSKNRHGTVQYVGPTPLGPGIWYGVELDSPDGLHDGCLAIDGKRYFHCKPQHGVFVRSQTLRRHRPTSNQERKHYAFSASYDGSQTRQSRIAASEYNNRKLFSSTIVASVGFDQSFDVNGIQSSTFNVGDKVLCHNHLAIVRYIGTTSFAEGIWIGIEFLSRSLGKNDGSVNGHVYFQCKPNHGLFVRPNRLVSTKK